MKTVSTDTEEQSQHSLKNEPIAPTEQKKLAGLEDSQTTTETDNTQAENSSSHHTVATTEPQQLIGDQYKYPQDIEQPEHRKLSEHKGLRSLIIFGLIGFVVALIGVGSYLFKKDHNQQQLATTNTSPETPPREQENQSDYYKSELALVDQGDDLQALTKTTPSPPEKPVVTASPPTVPAPTPQQKIVTRQIPTPPPPIRPAPPTPPTPPTPNNAPSLDPQAVWVSLSTLGATRPGQAIEAIKAHTSEENSAPTTSANNDFANDFASTSSRPPLTLPSSQPQQPFPPQAQSLQIASLTIGESNSTFRNLSNTSNNTLTEGAIGIIERHTSSNSSLSGKPSNLAPAQKRRYTVAIGSKAAAAMTVPIYWNSSGSSHTDGTFAVTLNQPLLSTDGEVALEAGTVLITKVTDVSSNGLVAQSAIAIVYRDSSGQIQQQELPENNLIVRGQAGEPLIAQTLIDPGPDIASQDALIGILSALGTVGEIINRPEEVIEREDNDGFETSRRRSTTNGDPDIIAAALEGFFKPTSKRVAARSDRAVEELLGRNKVMVVNSGEPVAVYVNSFLEVVR